MASTASSPDLSAAPLTPLGLYARYAFAGAQCASLTHAVLVPVDVVKTRLQMKGSPYTGMADAFSKIPKQEGVGALFLGFTPTVLGYAVQGAGKFGFFEFFKAQAVALAGPDNAARYQLPIYIAASSAAEVIGSVMLCPWEAVRIRSVAAGVPDSQMMSMFGRIAKTEGIWNGFFKGLGPVLLKQVPYTATQITAFSMLVDTTYSTILPSFTNIKRKEDLSTSNQLVVSATCGVAAGVASAITSHPADTILSRVNSVKSDLPVSKQLANTISELGWRGMWLGLGPRCLMVGALSAGMFLIYDSVKVMVGLPTTSGLSKKNQ